MRASRPSNKVRRLKNNLTRFIPVPLPGKCNRCGKAMFTYRRGGRLKLILDGKYSICPDCVQLALAAATCRIYGGFDESYRFDGADERVAAHADRVAVGATEDKKRRLEAKMSKSYLGHCRKARSFKCNEYRRKRKESLNAARTLQVA